MFWRALHWRAIPWAPRVAVLHPEYFAPDRELLDGAARVTTRQQLEEEIRDYAMDARNLNWWRRRLRCRLSTHRLRRIAAGYLSERQQARAAGRAIA